MLPDRGRGGVPVAGAEEKGPRFVQDELHHGAAAQGRQGVRAGSHHLQESPGDREL